MFSGMLYDTTLSFTQLSSENVAQVLLSDFLAISPVFRFMSIEIPYQWFRLYDYDGTLVARFLFLFFLSAKLFSQLFSPVRSSRSRFIRT